MQRKSLLEAYRRDRRALELPGYTREDLGHLVRYTPMGVRGEGFVVFTHLAAAEVDAEIARQIAYFSAMGRGFEWKAYASDAPSDLQARLGAAGFAAGDPEVLMSCEPRALGTPARRAPAGVELRRLADRQALHEVASLQEAIWARPFGGLAEHLAGAWDYSAYYAAYFDGRMIGSGWIEFASGSAFAELHGGSVLAEFRGRGVYSQLLGARLQDAAARDVAWVTVDAAPMSRPILEAKGFERLDGTRPMTWRTA